MSEPKLQDKPFEISKWKVWEAFERVKANKGAAGVDEQSIAQFEADRDRNLYRIWNRMLSGSYFPPPVKAVEIPKAGGKGVRVLGVPTVADRIAQTVARLYLEPQVEPIFHPDSYGYRPGRSALDAVAACRRRCWRADWVIDMDIRAFFDTVPWDLVLKAVARHLAPGQQWILLYVQRWLKAPLQQQDGTLVTRDRGTPQGSAISPLIANLFMHYAFDGMPSLAASRKWAWNCIRIKPGSCTARTPTGAAIMRPRRLCSWGMSSGPGWPRTGTASISCRSCPQSAPRR